MGLFLLESVGPGSRLAMYSAHSAQFSGSRENSSSRAWSSRENRSYERSRLSIQAPRSWAVEGDQSQIVVRCDRERSGGLTLWLRSRGTSDRSGHGVDRERPDNEEGENGFEEHDDMGCREEEEITTAPGLMFGR